MRSGGSDCAARCSGRSSSDDSSTRKSEHHHQSSRDEQSDRLDRLKREEENIQNQLKAKEKYLQDSEGRNNTYYHPFSSNNYHNDKYQTHYVQHVPQTYSYASYYPYSPFYWYYYDDYRSMFPQYYNYYLHHHPTIYPSTFGPLVLTNGNIFHLHHHHNHYNLNRVIFNLKECRSGPQYYFTVKVRGKMFRVFLGDVNDLFNIQCLYMMNAVISIGNIDYSEKLEEIYRNPSKSVGGEETTINVNPFKNSDYVPDNVELEEVNGRVKVLRFSLQESNLPDKKLIFYHLNHVVERNSDSIFRDLANYAKSGNVLFLVDHLQRNSVLVFRHFLLRYRRFSPHILHGLRYKRLLLFPRSLTRFHSGPRYTHRPSYIHRPRYRSRYFGK